MRTVKIIVFLILFFISCSEEKDNSTYIILVDGNENFLYHYELPLINEKTSLKFYLGENKKLSFIIYGNRISDQMRKNYLMSKNKSMFNYAEFIISQNGLIETFLGDEFKKSNFKDSEIKKFISDSSRNIKNNIRIEMSLNNL